MRRPNPGTNHPIIVLKKLLLLIIGPGCVLTSELPAQETWPQALRSMPLSAETPLNRDNCLPLLLKAFHSNQVVKALVFLPAVSDDFYLINRAQPKLNLKAANLLDAIAALTNVTAVRATFKQPLLLLHLDRDSLEPSMIIDDHRTADRLRQGSHLPHALWVDAHWEVVEPPLQSTLKMRVLPDARSMDAWHFARHNLAAWNLSDWDLLAALSLSGKTTISIEPNRLLFRNR